jgi:hypothetical protein
MKNVKIYDIKSTSLANAKALVAKNGKTFFWNASKFKSIKDGDYVFVINRFEKNAMLCSLTDVIIHATHQETDGLTKFEYDKEEYVVQDKSNSYNQFVVLSVIQVSRIPEGWHFEKPLGQSETYDLQRQGIKGNISDRVRKIEDLRKIFTSDPASSVLREAEQFLNTIDLNAY